MLVQAARDVALVGSDSKMTGFSEFTVGNIMTEGSQMRQPSSAEFREDCDLHVAFVERRVVSIILSPCVELLFVNIK